MYFDDVVPFNHVRALCQLGCQVCAAEGQPSGGKCAPRPVATLPAASTKSAVRRTVTTSQHSAFAKRPVLTPPPPRAAAGGPTAPSSTSPSCAST